MIIHKRFSICLVNNHIKKPAYEADDDISDSNSLPSLNSDKESQVNIYKKKDIL